MSNAAHNIRAAVEGLAREIGRRVSHNQYERTDPERRANMPPAHDYGAAQVERHAKAVLLDYLLGDFNPVKPGEVQPHDYVPDTSHYMGDCQRCGHRATDPIHTTVIK